MQWIELLKDYLGKKAGERLALDPADAAPLISAGIARGVTDDPIGAAVAKGLEGALGGFTRGLDAIVTEALKKFAAAQSLSRKNAVPLIFGEGGAGDPKKSFGDWCLAVARNDRHYLEKHYGSSFVAWTSKAALSEASGAAGGYTVPPEFYEQLQSVMAEEAIIRPRAFVVPMGSATLQMPYLDVSTVQATGTSPFFGGVAMTWTAEAQTRTETEPQFKQMELKAWELSGSSVASNVLLQDSVVSLEKFLLSLFGKAINWYEEYAFLQGSGVGKPQGMLGSTATIATGNNVGKTGRETANSITFGDISVMWSRLLPVSWGRAIWVGSPTTIPQILQLKDGASRAIFISVDQGAARSPTWNLLGRPFYPTEKLPALGTKGDLMLVDPGFYVIGDRQQLEVTASEHVNFLANQMTWRVLERIDGRPWLDKPITLQDGSTQVSPLVTLN